MSFLKSDLSRNFGIGFLAGAILVVMSASQGWNVDLAPPAQAYEASATSE
jgi:hypothetical protein